MAHMKDSFQFGERDIYFYFVFNEDFTIAFYLGVPPPMEKLKNSLKRRGKKFKNSFRARRLSILRHMSNI